MKKLTMAEWDKEYIAGTIERFDQKYTMGRRHEWDLSLRERMKTSSAIAEVSDLPGWTLIDWAMRAASRSQMGKLQLLNMSNPNQSYASETVAKELRANESSLKPSKGEKLDVSYPEKITRYIKKAAVYFGADLVGICKLDHRWIYSHSYNTKETTDRHQPQEIPEEYKYVIVLGFGGGYYLRRYFPSYINTWSSNGYRQVLTNAHLSAFIRYLGFKAIDCSFDDVALAIPQAMQAGLGQLGRNNLLITPQFGESVRLGQILTDLPLIPDDPIDFGVTEFCNVCKKCANACPSGSISHGNRTPETISISNVAGEQKWQFSPETCHIHLYGHKDPCQTCISVCPFTKPNTFFHQGVRWFIDKARWADSFYVRLNDVFGYDKPKKADNFWEDWEPEKY